MCMSCRSLFVLSSFFFWSLCCLSFFDLRILITTLISSNSSSNLPTWLCLFIVWVRVVLFWFTFIFVLLYCIPIVPFHLLEYPFILGEWELYSLPTFVLVVQICNLYMHSQHYHVISNRKRKKSSTLHWQIGVYPDSVIMTQFHITCKWTRETTILCTYTKRKGHASFELSSLWQNWIEKFC